MEDIVNCKCSWILLNVDTSNYGVFVARAPKEWETYPRGTTRRVAFEIHG